MAIKIKTQQRYEARARIAKALSHPTRLLLLDLLKDGDKCVCDLTEVVGADQSTVSKHLAILRDAGMIDGRKEGTMSFYSLKCTCLDGFFGCIEQVLRQNLKAHQAAVGR